MRLQDVVCCISIVVLTLVLSSHSSTITPKSPSETKSGQTTTSTSTSKQTNAQPQKSPTTQISNNQATSTNVTTPLLNGTLPDSWYGHNKGMLQRTVYVVLGITAIVIIYFGVRAWRTRRRSSKTRKYGLISTGADLEMEPLESHMDDDEDDMTVFEQNGRRK